MKKALSVLLALLLLASLFSAAAYAANTESGVIDNLKWTLNKDTGELTVTGTGAMKNYNHRTIKSPFDSRTDISTVTVGYGVTSIGNFAFYGCTGILEVNLSATVTSLGSSAFYGCRSLLKINPDPVATIGSNAFCSTGITEISLSKKVTSIGSGAFADCPDLKRITVDGDNTKYGSDAAGVLFSKEDGALTRLIQYPSGRMASAYGIPDTVKTVGRSAFTGCLALRDVLIPASVETIEPYAFEACGLLTRVGFGENIKTVGVGAFHQDDKLKFVYCEGDGPEMQAEIGENNEPLTAAFAYRGCTFGVCGEEMVYYYTPFAKLTLIEGKGAMDTYDSDMNPSELGYLDMQTAEIGPDVESVSDYAFYGCTSLKQIRVNKSNMNYVSPDGVLFSGDRARLCAYPAARTNESYEVPEYTEEIAPGAFGENCTALKKITLPASLEKVGYGAFEYCGALSEVTYRSNAVAWSAIEIENANDPLTNAARVLTADKITLTVTAPKAGEAPKNSVTPLPAALEKLNPCTDYSVSWSPADAKFREGQAYTVTVLARLKNNYLPPEDEEDATVTVNGNPAEVTFDSIALAGHEPTYYVKVTYTFLPAFTLGDVDGEKGVTAADARLALRAAVGLENYEPGSRAFLAADVDKSNSVTAADARLILRKAVGYTDAEWGA